MHCRRPRITSKQLVTTIRLDQSALDDNASCNQPNQRDCMKYWGATLSTNRWRVVKFPRLRKKRTLLCFKTPYDADVSVAARRSVDTRNDPLDGLASHARQFRGIQLCFRASIGRVHAFWRWLITADCCSHYTDLIDR